MGGLVRTVGADKSQGQVETRGFGAPRPRGHGKVRADVGDRRLPALVEALELVLATPKIREEDDGLMERLVRAEPVRARRVLESLTGAGAGRA
jgi:hypothetical protein